MISSSAGDNPRAGRPLTIGFGGRGPCVPCGAPAPDHIAGDRSACEKFLIALITLFEAFIAYLTVLALCDVVRGVFLGGSVPALVWGTVLMVAIERCRRMLIAGRNSTPAVSTGAAHGR